MQNKSVKWLMYTVLVGLIPIVSRLLVWGVTTQGTIEPVNAGDFIAFGLVLHISIINEIEHRSANEKSWKTTQNGVSIAFISFYSVLFCLTLLSAPASSFVDMQVVTYCVISLSFVSFLLSFSVFYRLAKIPERDS